MDPEVVDDEKAEEPYRKRFKLEIGEEEFDEMHGWEERDAMSGGEEQPDEMSGEEEPDEKECDPMSSSSSSGGTYVTSSDETDGYTSEDARLFKEEFARSGDYDFDASKVGGLVVYYPVVFENSDYAQEPETDGQLMERLSRAALEKYNHDKQTNFEFVRAVKANWNLGGGHVFSITLEAKDPCVSHSDDPIPFTLRLSTLQCK